MSAVAGEGRHVSSPSEWPMKRGSCPFDPPPEYARLRAERPITRARIWDGTEVWLVTRYEDGRTLLTDRRMSSRGDLPGYPFPTPALAGFRSESPSFVLMDDPEHNRLRRMLTSDFTARRMKELRPAIQRITDLQIDSLVAHGPPGDLVADFALPIPSLVICEMLGVEYEDRQFFQERSITALQSDRAQAAKATADLRSYFEALVDKKAAEPDDGLISRVYAEYVEPGELERGELAQMATTLLVAGHETTASQISLGCLALLQHPAQLAAFRRQMESPDELENAVEELLRYLTVAQSGRARVALEDIEIGDVTIRAGDGVIVLGDSCNRDRDVFTDADELELGRPDARRHVAFGTGVHRCLGEPLAETELQEAYSRLFRRLPSLRLAVPFEDIRYTNDKASYGVQVLPVEW